MDTIDTNDAIELFKNATTAEIARTANEITSRTYGNKVFVRGLIEFSNHCGIDCLYCGIRRSNNNVHRYMLSNNEILSTVKQALENGIMTIVLQSGENHTKITELTQIVSQIRNIAGDEIAITLSCGLLSRNEYKELKLAGANRYLMRFETSDEQIYKRLKNGQSLATRLAGLDALRELGYEVGSGYMVGLPGETLETRINNALLCKKLELNMVGIGPFIPHKETPLANEPHTDIDTVIRSVALLRLLLPLANIPATTAVGSIDDDGRQKALSAGANVIMPNITPTTYKKDYLIYPGKICLHESGYESIKTLSKKLTSIGKELSFARGNSALFS